MPDVRNSAVVLGSPPAGTSSGDDPYSLLAERTLVIKQPPADRSLGEHGDFHLVLNRCLCLPDQLCAALVGDYHDDMAHLLKALSLELALHREWMQPIVEPAAGHIALGFHDG